MKRILSVGMIFLVILSTFSIFAPQAKAEEGTTQYPWMMFHHDLRHTGFSPSPAPSTSHVLWTFETGDKIVSSPAVVNGKVFIGSMDNSTYAIDQFDGTLIWSAPVDDSVFFGSPAVDSNKVFITVDDEIFALDETTGDIIWRKVLGTADYSSPAVADGVVFVGSSTDGPMGHVFALDANTGSIIWSHSDITGVWSSPAVADGMVFVSSMIFSVHGIPGKVFALNQSSGELIWATEIGDGAFISSPVVLDGRVFVGGLGFVDGEPAEGHVYALDEYTGSILWQKQTGAEVYSSPAVAYGKVFVGCYDGKIYAFDEVTGNIIWTFQTEDRIEASSPAVADGKVFIGSDDGNLYALDATTGSKMWNYTTGHCVESSPAVADGVVYVGSLDGKVYAFGSLGPLLPVADFTYSPTAPDISEKVYFDASASYDPDGGRIVSYLWDFGDGKSRRGKTVDHRYRSEGTYTATLTVTDDDGQAGTTSATITVVIRMYHELFLEIDYMEGHAPSYSALTYIKNYFKERRISVLIYFSDEINTTAWHQVDLDERTTETEFAQLERIYNNLGDDKSDPCPVYTSKWKWILFGARSADHPTAGGLTYTNDTYRWTAGNYIFIADDLISTEEVETVVLMHELGHSIGIWDWSFSRKTGRFEEKYDGNPWSVMTKGDKYEYNDEIDERYSEHYWKMRDMGYYEI